MSLARTITERCTRFIDGELADVVVGKLVGRLSDIDITLFSSTGLAIQDVALGISLLGKLNL